MLVEKMKSIKSSYDFDFDPRELHYQASRDFKHHKRTQSRLDTMSKLDLIMRNGRQEEVLDESILAYKIKQDNL